MSVKYVVRCGHGAQEVRKTRGVQGDWVFRCVCTVCGAFTATFRDPEIDPRQVKTVRTLAERRRSKRRRAYLAHLRSAAWARLRRAVFERDGYLCACGEPATEVHHLTYERFGAERLEDLTSICKDCHDAVDGRRS